MISKLYYFDPSNIFCQDPPLPVDIKKICGYPLGRIFLGAGKGRAPPKF